MRACLSILSVIAALLIAVTTSSFLVSVTTDVLTELQQREDTQ